MWEWPRTLSPCCNVLCELGRVQEGELTADGAVLDAEELGLVVPRDCGVRVHVAWQHRQVLGHVRSSHPFFF
jgi:hypothetical protein